MARSAIGAVTLTDVTDGTNPISVLQSNENHTFAAALDGAVVNTEFGAYSTTVTVFLGTTRISFDATSTTDAAMSNSTFRFAKTSLVNTDKFEVTGSGWPAASNYTGAAVTSPKGATIDASDVALTNTSADSGSLTVNIRVKNAAGGVELVTLQTSFNKAITGAGGDIVQLDASKQYFTADSAGTYNPVTQGDIVVNIYTQGVPGAQNYYIAENGGSFSAVTTAANTKGKIKGFDTTRNGTFATTGTISTAALRLTLSTANLGTNDTMTLKVTGATDSNGNDTMSFTKVRNGVVGAGAIYVDITSSANGFAFKSTDTSDKTLTAVVYDAASGNQLTGSTVSYHWKLNDNSGNTVQVDNATDRNVQAGTGTDASGTGFPTIIVGNTDVTGSQGYICLVTVD